MTPSYGSGPANRGSSPKSPRTSTSYGSPSTKRSWTTSPRSTASARYHPRLLFKGMVGKDIRP
ncbi:MAG: hypothetical protein ACLRWP_13745 [Bilophila wadsworthia]